MTDNKPTNTSSSDEIDLGQLIKTIGRGFNNLFKAFLRFFIYLRSNFVTLAILVFVGFAIGFALKFFISDELKTEVIVRPNFNSKDYLYNVVEEIETHLKVKDTAFFGELGVVASELKNLKIEIEELKEETNEEKLENDLEYLEILQNFQQDDFVLEIIKTEILKKSKQNHRIIFYYKNPLAGRVAAMKLMQYIENNIHYGELKEVYNENARAKIKRNGELIQQIDSVIFQYTKALSMSNVVDQGKVLLDNEKGLDVAGLLSLKNRLVEEIGLKKLEILKQKEVVSIVNFGKTQKVRTPIYAQGIAVIPGILLILFFIYSILKYLNRKANELE